MLSLTRLGRGNKEKAQQFLSDVNRAYKYTKIVANKQETEQSKQQILKWAHSEARRVEILEAMLADDMDTVSELLREAIEKAFEERNKRAP